MKILKTLVFILCYQVTVTSAWASAALRSGEHATAIYSNDGDFLFSGIQSTLVRWKGLFAGVNLDSEQPTLGNRIFGNLFSSKNPTRISTIAMLPHAPAFLKTLDQDRILASWTCNDQTVFLHLAPLSSSPAPLERVQFSISELLPPRLATSASNTKIEGCGITADARPFVIVKDNKTLYLNEAFTDRFEILWSGEKSLTLLATGIGDSFVDLVFIEHEPESTLARNILTSRWHLGEPIKPLLRVNLAIQGHDSQFMRAIARNAQALLASEGQIWLLQLNDPEQEPFRLPVAPCEDQQICGLSLAQDGSWAASGHWGHYVGRGGLFRRIPLPQFSSPQGPLALAHSGVPGEAALFGEFDASFETIGLSLPNALQRRPETMLNTASPPETAIAWLRPGRDPLPHESVILKLSPGAETLDAEPHETRPTTLIATKDPFNPERQIAYELPAQFQLEADLDDHKITPQSAQADFWWQEDLQFQNLNDTLQSRHMEAPHSRLAIIDSGADLDHADFQPLAKSKPEGAGLTGYDFVDEDRLPQDEFGHGTHVSGLAKPPFWIFSNVELLIYRALDSRGKSNSIDLGRAILEASRQKAQVINASWGGGSPTQFMSDAILAAQQSGALFITSAGNDGLSIDNSPPVPSQIPGVISIGARDQKGHRARFSNYGRKNVLTLLPGVDILSLALGGGYTLKSGTSMAAPLFSGFASMSLGLLQEMGFAEPQEAQKLLVTAFCDSSRGPTRASSCDQGDFTATVEALLALQN